MRDGRDLPTDDQSRAAREALVARIALADDVLREYARRKGVSAESLPASFVKAVRQACLDLEWGDVPAQRGRPQPFRRART